MRWFALLGAAVIGCGSADPPLEPKLSVIDAHVFEASCTAACHSGGPEVAAGGLDLSTSLHASLVGAPATAVACADGKTMRVVPGAPDESLLYTKIAAKIAGVDPPCGEGMPLGVGRDALSDDDAELVRAWIEAGAPDD